MTESHQKGKIIDTPLKYHLVFGDVRDKAWAKRCVDASVVDALFNSLDHVARVGRRFPRELQQRCDVIAIQDVSGGGGSAGSLAMVVDEF